MILVEDEYYDACRTRLYRISSASLSNNAGVIGDPAYVYRETHRTRVFSSVFKRIWVISVAYARDSPPAIRRDKVRCETLNSFAAPRTVGKS
jgi:hypothetical protein